MTPPVQISTQKRISAYGFNGKVGSEQRLPCKAKHGGPRVSCCYSGKERAEGFEPRVMVPEFLHILISWFLEISRHQIVAYVTVRISGRSSDLHYGATFLMNLDPAIRMNWKPEGIG